MMRNGRPEPGGTTAAPLAWAAAVAVVLAFLYLAARNLRLPGLYYDECIFVNAALGGINDDFVTLRLFRVPVMIMPYIGALKSYLYAPVFMVAGVNPESIRLPVIVLSAGTLVFSFLLARRLFGACLALLYLALLATDPAFIFNVRLDSGPVALMLFFKTGALYFFFRFLEAGSPRFAWLLVASLSLGIFDKLNFIWFVIALGVSAPCFFGAELKAVFTRQRRRLLTPLIVFGLVLCLAAALIVIILLNFKGNMPSRSLVEKVRFVIALYRGTMNGASVYGFLTGGAMAAPSGVHYLLAPVAAGLLTLVLARNRAADRLSRLQRRLPWFLLAAAAIIFVQIVMTREVGGAHHLMMLHPFHHLLFIALVAAVVPLCGESFRKPLAVCCLVAVLGTVYSQVRADGAYAAAFAGGSFNKRWDPQIYALADYLEGRAADAVISTDWGIHTQLFCLAGRERRAGYIDAWPMFKSMADYPADRQQCIYDTFFRGRSVQVVAHTPDAEIMAGTRDNFTAFARRFRTRVELEKVFHNSSGEGLYEVYRVDAMYPRQTTEAAP